MYQYSQPQNFNYLLQKYQSMGFSKSIIEQAFSKCSNPNNENMMIDTLNILQKQYVSNPKVLNEDESMNIAIMNSLESANQSLKNLELTNPKELKRKEGVPVGLKNIGNTCYFNSLLQTYFMNHKFVKEILDFEEDIYSFPELKSSKRVKSSIQLVKNLQKLFAFLIKSDKKYIDPSEVLNSIVDDNGNNISIGDQKDIAEYNLVFLARIEEGLRFKKEKINSQNSKFFYENGSNLSKSTIINKNQINNSPLRESAIIFKYDKEKEESIISQMFFGKMKQTILYRENNEEIEKTTIEKFNMILLDVKYKDLYTSWELLFSEKLEDFKNSIGEITNAIKRNTLVRVPSVLFYQLQRVIYDKEKGPQKINDKFNFEKEIYIDRFLDSNYNTYRQIQDKVQNLKSKQQIIEEDIKKYLNYEGSNLGIIEIFEKVEGFINKQRNFSNDSFFFGISNISETNSCSNLLFTYKQFINKKMNELKNSLIKIEKEIEGCYNRFKKTCKYYLISILIHEGEANSGHYFSYIHDFERKIWRKYNDQYVTEESEEKIIEDSHGFFNNLLYFTIIKGDGIKTKNAYCLIYMRDTLIENDQNINIPFRLYLTSENEEKEDLYTKYLNNTSLSEIVKLDNLAFLQKIDSHSTESLLKSILEEYTTKYTYVQNLLKSYTKESTLSSLKMPNLSSFYIYLKHHPTENDLSEFIKLDLFSKTLKSLHPDKIEVKDLANHSIFADKLNQKVTSELNKNIQPNLLLSQHEINHFLEEYLIKIEKTEICNYFFEQSLSENFEKGFFAADYLLEREKALYYCKLLLAYLIKHINKEEIVYFQIHVFWSEIIDGLNEIKNIKKEEISEINDCFNKIEAIPFFKKLYEINYEDFKEQIENAKNKYHPDNLNFNKTDNSIVIRLRDNFKKFENEYWPFCNLYKDLVSKKTTYLIDDLKKNGLL